MLPRRSRQCAQLAYRTACDSNFLQRHTKYCRNKRHGRGRGCHPDISLHWPGSNIITSDVVFRARRRYVLTLGTVVLTAIVRCTPSLRLYAYNMPYKGLPCSSFLAKVPTQWEIPINAIVVSALITSVLSLINLGKCQTRRSDPGNANKHLRLSDRLQCFQFT